jgi:hypothetical protein
MQQGSHHHLIWPPLSMTSSSVLDILSFSLVLCYVVAPFLFVLLVWFPTGYLHWISNKSLLDD